MNLIFLKILKYGEFNIGKIIILLIGILINFFYRLFYFLIIKNLTAIHIIFSNLFYSTLLASIGNMFYNPLHSKKHNFI